MPGQCAVARERWGLALRYARSATAGFARLRTRLSSNVRQHPATMSAPVVSLFKLSVSAAFVASVLALVASAIYAFRLRCEGFGCTGVGIVWVAWVFAYAPVLAIGAVLRSVLPGDTSVRTIVSTGLLALVALGAALACYWLLHNAA
jgi:hypothetical protein